MSTHSTKQFSYNNKTRTFVAFASDIAINPTQLYPDACDVGIVLVSHVTGKEIKFYLSDTVVKDGDLTHWKFRNDQVNCTVVVYNT